MREAGSGQRVLVVVPALNEERSVGGVVERVHEALPAADVLVVDDGSSDRTSDAAAAAGARVVTLPFNLGVGGAMRTGFRYAVRQGYDAVVQIDADGQHDPRYLPAVLAGLDDANVVIGARFAGEGDYRVKGPRAWAMRLLSVVVGRIVGARLTDVTSGFRAADAQGMRVFARHYPAEYLGDTVESLVIARKTGLRIRQVAVAMSPRLYGRPSQALLGSVTYLARAAVALLLALLRTWPVEETR